MKKVVILTGAGISAESGIATFRGGNGLWDNHKIEDVCTIAAWDKDPELVQRFYNDRRKSVKAAVPNAAHIALAELESKYEVHVITQNIDDLHERAGSTNVLHLHGLITKSQSSVVPRLVYDVIGDEIKMGDLCELGKQLRPHVVFFGENVPNMPVAIKLVEDADIFIVCGTSLAVYPAASILYYLPFTCERYIVDLDNPLVESSFTAIQKNASEGIPELVSSLLSRDIEEVQKGQ